MDFPPLMTTPITLARLDGDCPGYAFVPGHIETGVLVAAALTATTSTRCSLWFTPRSPRHPDRQLRTPLGGWPHPRAARFLMPGEVGAFVILVLAARW
jgi:hypothetical protein